MKLRGLIDFEGLFEQSGQLGKNRFIDGHKLGASFHGGVLRDFIRFARERHDRIWAVFSFARMSLMTPLTSPRLAVEVHDDDHRRLLLYLRGQGSEIGAGGDAVAEVLQAVDQLAAGHQALVENQRERFRHRR
jgi:hypothetical protein